jgi:imidazolonepropionase
MLITNIRQLVNVREEAPLLRGAELAKLPTIENAYLQIEDGCIAGYGSMEELQEADFKTELIDARQASVLPSWCDSHTHLVFATSREGEFVDKIKGLSYAEIAAKCGGILHSAEKIQKTEESTLLKQAQARLDQLIRLGTGAIEIKSGYGLSLNAELKMLRVIRQLKAQNDIPIKATFLGAHALPLSYQSNRAAYIDLLIREMLPQIAEEQLADYIDVFCEKGFFTPEETESICLTGQSYGLQAKIHANQLSNSGGVQAGCKVQALSVDHLESIGETEMNLLAQPSAPIATLLPTAAFFLRMQYAPARELILRNAAIALASDFNPGSSPSGNMNFVVALACIQMRMLPEEAIQAATINGAYAMGIQNIVGSITTGKLANLIFTKPIPSLAYLPYAFTENMIERVMVKGKFMD